MAEQHLTKNIRLVGEWFLPQTEKRIPGVFIYESGQIRLDLLRSFDHDEKNIERIYGVTHMGMVTLFDVVFNSISGVGTAYGAIFGKHMNKDDYIERAIFNFDLLDEWAISMHRLKFPDDPHEQINYINKTTEEFKFQIDGDIQCTLTISHGMTFHYLEGVRQFPRSHFTIEFKHGKELRELVRDYVYGLKYFLMTIMGRNLNLTELFWIDKSNNSPIYIPLEKKSGHGSYSDHFFNIAYIRDNYEKILKNWFSFYASNKALLDLFIVTYEKRFVETLDFFVYAAILEGYYKDTFVLCSTSPSRKKKYKERINDVLSQNFANDFVNLDKFVEKVDSMRHDLFHLNKRAEFEDELMPITHDLFFLLRIIFLNHIGCDLTIDSLPRQIVFKFLKCARTTHTVTENKM